MKQLFQLMLQHQDLFHSGMCHWIYKMLSNDIINDKEYCLLNKYLKKNKPLDAKKYWFTYGEIAPRIEWINQQIEKL
jgi:hypothetical protein